MKKETKKVDATTKPKTDANTVLADSFKTLLREAWEKGCAFQKAIDNTISRMEKRLPYNRNDLNVKNFDQWTIEKMAEIDKLCGGGF